MRSYTLLSAFVALAAAAPHPQAIDLDGVDAKVKPTTVSMAIGAASQVVKINVASAVAAIVHEVSATPIAEAGGADVPVGTVAARAACDPQATSVNTYNVDLTSAQSFRQDSNIAAAAKAASAPSGYNQTFMNLGAANIAYGYMGYTVISSYDPSQCASQCNSQPGCLGFNLYFERDPVLEPGVGCANPNATANIKCSFWAGPVTAISATNAGQTIQQFEVAIAGSNGYTTTNFKTLTGYTNPTYLGNVAINAPLDCNKKSTYMGYKLLTSGAFDPMLCTAACEAQNAYNLRHPPKTGAPKICRFINTYMLYKNGVPQGQYCSLYTESWSPSHATSKGKTRGADHYTIDYSFTYANATDPGVPVCPAHAI